ncbi:MAG: pentapeptide repeat-containing protein [Chloroflexota bacterium]|nr:pentapeptide repeat-containing protein [Chloroflexota bacterium]
MNRREKIRKIHSDYAWFYPLIVGVTALAIGVWIGILLGETHFKFEARDYHVNLWTEAIGVLAGVGITVLVIDQINGYRIRRDLKHRLARGVRSRSYDVAMSAIEELDHQGWLTGDSGALQGADLMEARLNEARLNGANLADAILEQAELNRTKLTKATLRGAILTFAKLHNARLNEADMRNAKCHGVEMPDARLGGACLVDADLSYACLEGASLRGACLNGADLHSAKLKGAVLWDADFRNANLMFSELREAEYLNKANWEGTKLFKPDLKCVDFSETNMKDAGLEYADLRSANLEGTNLEGANLYGALLGRIRFNRIDMPVQVFAGEPPVPEGVGTTYPNPKTNWLGAILPDGTTFTENMDYRAIERFVEPRHPDFPTTLERVLLIRKHAGLIDDDNIEPD